MYSGQSQHQGLSVKQEAVIVCINKTCKYNITESKVKHFLHWLILKSRMRQMRYLYNFLFSFSPLQCGSTCKEK